MTERRRLEPLRLDRPAAAPVEAVPPAGPSPAARQRDDTGARTRPSSTTTHALLISGVGALLMIVGIVVVYFAAFAERHDTAPPASGVKPKTATLPPPTVPENDGSDAARPILPKIDEGFVDTRGGWGWGDKCWANIKATKWGWAKAECDEGMKINPASPQPRASLLYNEGLVAKGAGNIDEARANFLESLALREHPEVRGALNSLPVP